MTWPGSSGRHRNAVGGQDTFVAGSLKWLYEGNSIAVSKGMRILAKSYPWFCPLLHLCPRHHECCKYCQVRKDPHICVGPCYTSHEATVLEASLWSPGPRFARHGSEQLSATTRSASTWWKSAGVCCLNAVSSCLLQNMLTAFTEPK